MQRLSPGRARDHPVMEIVPDKALLSLSVSLSELSLAIPRDVVIRLRGGHLQNQARGSTWALLYSHTRIRAHTCTHREIEKLGRNPHSQDNVPSCVAVPPSQSHAERQVARHIGRCAAIQALSLAILAGETHAEPGGQASSSALSGQQPSEVKRDCSNSRSPVSILVGAGREQGSGIRHGLSCWCQASCPASVRT